MIFPLKLKQPCSNCPFRTDRPFYLRPGRRREIARGLIDEGSAFHCHKTVDYNDDECNETGGGKVRDYTQVCAGAMIFLENVGKPNQIMQVASRLGLWSKDRLELDAPVFKTREAFENADDASEC